MLFPFTSWESLARPDKLFQGAQTQVDGYQLQLVRFARENLPIADRLVTPCNWLFFRSLQSEDEACFAVTSSSGSPFTKDILSVSFFNDGDTLETQRERFERALQHGDFARFFFLDEHEEPLQGDAIARFAVLMGAEGWAQWIRLSAGLTELPLFRRHTAFCWNHSSDINQFLTTPAKRQWQQIADQKADASSDCAFARRALDWSKQELNSLIHHWTKGSLAELEAALRAALIEQADLWTSSATYEWVIELDRLHKSWYKGKWTRLDPSVITDGTPPITVHAVLRRVAPYFEIAFNEELTTRHLEAARGVYRFNETLIIRIETPTAHERLEAALFWREWQDAHPSVP